MKDARYLKLSQIKITLSLADSNVLVFWCMIASVLFMTILGIPLALIVLFAAGMWAIYRIARESLARRDRKPMYNNCRPPI